MTEGAHCSHDGLGVEDVDGVAGCKDGLDSKPMGGAYDGSEIPGVLHAVEHEIQIGFKPLAVIFLAEGKGKHGVIVGGGAQCRYF